MRKLTAKQTELLALVKANPGHNTSTYCQIRKDNYGYPSFLRDRLFRLASRGLMEVVERKGKNDWVIERLWFPVY